eukprot:GHVN01091661.1.p1 GENE.GHVN01091661.1~~GHVN01091661.1.p1  ORF type:complete len:188 (+),score=8.70 GHVN01091661.1:641-1204(+)
MPPILGLIISRCDNDETVVFLSTAHDLSQFKLWERKTVKEGCLFISRTVSTRVAVGSRQIIEHEGQGAFVARWNDGICVTMVADLTYPQRVAFLCLEEVHTTFKRTVGVTVWARVAEDDVCDFKSELRAILKNYQVGRTAYYYCTIAQPKGSERGGCFDKYSGKGRRGPGEHIKAELFGVAIGCCSS